ncbi:MAG: phage tail protein [Acidobacteriaceae bacterium]|nr:phage tail protein [Acidobacteriaceae bacterium]
MSTPFLAEIRIFAGGFAPRGWAKCEGQLMPISQNTALFSLLGTTYGGDGRSTFALPNLLGSAPMQAGQGQGLSQRFLGENGGEQTVTLLQSEMPAHSHTPQGDAGSGQPSPSGNAWGGLPRGHGGIYTPPPANVLMNTMTIPVAGGSQPHNNMPPFLGLTFIIALQGVFPQRP